MDGIVRNVESEIESAYSNLGPVVFLTMFAEWSTQWLKDGSGLMAHKCVLPGMFTIP